MMAKLWQVNWTPTVLTGPALEPSSRPDSPLFHTSHGLEPALGNSAEFFFQQENCVCPVLERSIITAYCDGV